MADYQSLRDFSKTFKLDLPEIVDFAHRAVFSRSNVQGGQNRYTVCARERQLLRRALWNAVSEVNKLGETFGVSGETVLRNLIAEACPEELAGYWLLAKYASSRNIWPAKVLRFLPAVPERFLSVYQLAHVVGLSRRRPSKHAVHRFASQFPSKRLRSAVFSVCVRDFSGVRAPDAGQHHPGPGIIRELATVAAYGGSLGVWLEKAVYRPAEVFSKLRTEIVCDYHRNTPISDKAVGSRIDLLKDVKLRHCLQYLGKSAAKRPYYLLHLSPEDRSELVQSLPEEDLSATMQHIASRGLRGYFRKFPVVDTRRLYGLCGEKFWARALWTASRGKTMDEILDKAGTGRRDLFEGCFNIANAWYPWIDREGLHEMWPRGLAERYVRYCGDAGLPESMGCSSLTRLVAHLGSGRFPGTISRAAGEAVESCLPDAEADLLRLLSLDAVRSCLDRTDLLPAFQAAVANFLNRPSPDSARIAGAFLRPTPALHEALAESVGDHRFSRSEFALLCRALDQLRVRVCSPLISFRGREEGPAWKTLLSDAEKTGRSVPDVLRNTLKRADIESLAEALVLRPDLFGAAACKRVPLKKLLTLAFKFPAVAAQVERRVSRRRRRAELGWVRSTWCDSPYTQAAYEAALLFSLKDARYLLWLAHRIRVPDHRSRRGRHFDDLYRTHKLPKKTGGYRTITVPDRRLKRLQRRLLDEGFARVRLSRDAHGFRKGHSILTNAMPHVGKPMVVNVDIESFFPNTKYDQIVRACRRLCGGRLSERTTRFVADLCSYGGALPTGAPTSPAVGNIVLHDVDRALSRAGARFDISYSRYADDLTFSGHNRTHLILPFVEHVLAERGYRLAPDKFNFFRRGRRQMVTGLVVNDKPNLPRRLRRRLRAAVHHRTRGKMPYWQDRPMGDAELRGRLAFLKLVQPDEALHLLRAVGASPLSFE